MKHLLFTLASPYGLAFDNDALIPEYWAQEALMILENNMVMGNLVHRDFSPMIAQAGDTVNAHRPATRRPTRKVDADEVESTTTDSINVPVVLNQHIYDSFIIKDGEESKAMKSLVEEHLLPSVQGMADTIDQILIGSVYQFIGTGRNVGKLGTDVTKTTMTEVRDMFNRRKVPSAGRNLVISSAMEQKFLDTDLFTSAEKVGDNGTALREGNLGRKFGINTFMDQNTPDIIAGMATRSGAVNNASGYAAGSTTMAVDGITGALIVGSWFTVAGDMTPQQVVSSVGGATPTSVTFSPGLQHAVADNAVITIVTPGAVDLTAGYAAGYAKDIVVDGFSISPKTGQLVSLGTNPYALINSRNSPTTTSLMLDRPLEAAAADNAVVGLGPAGSYGFAFHKNALALVSRPLAAPRPGAGALGFTASYNGLSMRVVIAYDAKAQGHRVTVDTLLGTKVLDQELGFPVYG